MNYPYIVAAIDTQLALLRAARALLITPSTSAQPSNLDETFMNKNQEKPVITPALVSAPSITRGQLTATPQPAAIERRNSPQPQSTVAVMDEPEAEVAEDSSSHPRVGRRGSRRNAPVVSGALGGARPTGPVFVPAAAVAATRPTRPEVSRYRAAKPAAAAMKPKEGTLDALLRDFARGKKDDAKDPKRAFDLLSFGM
jgi:hypothetical protein